MLYESLVDAAESYKSACEALEETEKKLSEVQQELVIRKHAAEYFEKYLAEQILLAAALVEGLAQLDARPEAAPTTDPVEAALAQLDQVLEAHPLPDDVLDDPLDHADDPPSSGPNGENDGGMRRILDEESLPVSSESDKPF